jgi:hypothetical protein
MTEENFEQTCISHLGTIELDQLIVTNTKERLAQITNLTFPLEEELKLLEQLTQFDLGRFLLVNKGLDGYWIDYIISGNHDAVEEGSLEDWLLKQAPIVQATKERFKIFQDETQKRLKSDISLASIPCGSMNDLLLLDYTKVINVNLIGVDIDQKSINLAQENIDRSIKTSFSATLLKQDAWNLDQNMQFNMILSNGLNIYEPNETRLIELYTKFYNALTHDGVLITSFITKSPAVDANSPWKNINKADLAKQKALFADIIQAKWQNSLSQEQVIYQLNQAGFTDIKIIYDTQGMFPTVIAKR